MPEMGLSDSAGAQECNLTRLVCLTIPDVLPGGPPARPRGNRLHACSYSVEWQDHLNRALRILHVLMDDRELVPSQFQLALDTHLYCCSAAARPCVVLRDVPC